MVRYDSLSADSKEHVTTALTVRVSVYCDVLYSTVLYCTVLYSTLL